MRIRVKGHLEGEGGIIDGYDVRGVYWFKYGGGLKWGVALQIDGDQMQRTEGVYDTREEAVERAESLSEQLWGE